jgi:hypothetical protein
LKTGTIGFGSSQVTGCRRVPFPPARITAFTDHPPIQKALRLLIDHLFFIYATKPLKIPLPAHTILRFHRSNEYHAFAGFKTKWIELNHIDVITL